MPGSKIAMYYLAMYLGVKTHTHILAALWIPFPVPWGYSQSLRVISLAWLAVANIISKASVVYRSFTDWHMSSSLNCPRPHVA